MKSLSRHQKIRILNQFEGGVCIRDIKRDVKCSKLQLYGFLIKIIERKLFVLERTLIE